MSNVHVLPVNDVIEHEDVGDKCICGPDVEVVEPNGLLISHHSLDGREKSE